MIAICIIPKCGKRASASNAFCGSHLVADRKTKVSERHDMVMDHPMCASLTEDAGYYTVIYPAGDFPVHGVRATKAGGKHVALGHLLTVMERHWVESFPGHIKEAM